MKQEEIARLEDFYIFCKNAGTRGGSRFVIEYLSPAAPGGESTKAIGKVYLKTMKEDEIPLAMEWDMSGNALKIGGQFDLVSEENFDF